MIEFVNLDLAELWQGTQETLILTGVSLFFTVLLGLPLGVLLFWSSSPQLQGHKGLYRVLSLVVNVLRSLPFIILLIVMIPLTVWLIGTSIGVEGAIPPLVAAAVPFFARLVENVLRDLDKGIIEACQAMGAQRWQILWLALLPEALPGLLAAVTVTAISLVGYSAMSGVIGGGGLGDLAVRYGYQRFQTDVMVVTVFILIVLVQVLQWAGDKAVAHFTRK
ncbi:methionine ABC transporter permease [Aquaspirillum serpens]|uniref:methionine ABC transporter permease n=1 Tax=Aquaspirillum serpens TaxID=190 RepID=UPI0003B54D3C|nr:methionine ABC transporter permease [Aquaspirillum serpens]